MARTGTLRYRLNRLWRVVRGRAWQVLNRGRLRSPQRAAEVVWFAMPLISRRRAQDWAAVEARLAVTLASVLAQTDGRWRLTICGQDRPEALPDDPRIRFLKAEIPDRFNDQREKGKAMTADLAERSAGAGYYFKLDADDILHPGLVGHVLGDDNGQGYLIDRGYILDAGHLAETGGFRIGMLCPPSPEFPQSQEFYRTCGSCAAFWYDLSSGADFKTLLDRRGSHHQLIENLGDFGFRMETVPFPAGVYVINHGSNMRQRRGAGGYMLGLVEKNLIADPGPVIEAFGLRGLFGMPGAQGRVSSGG